MLGAVLLGWALLGAGLVAQERSNTSAATAVAPINLNTASAAELETLPGVGATTAARIVEYREKSGGFKKVEELMNVRGIGEKSFLKLKAMITVGPPKVDRAAQ
ncbi:MAG: helix-hairpin-helix domain-containing protein [Acidimicrobiia bacterium]|nr:helix-hairpin-helix domain-containing protein [Acidimicrobiia bacterium]